VCDEHQKCLLQQTDLGPATTSSAKSKLEKTQETKRNTEMALKTLEQKVLGLEQQTMAVEKAAATHHDDAAPNEVNLPEKVNLPEELAQDKHVAPGQEATCNNGPANKPDKVNLPEEANLAKDLARDGSVAPGKDNNVASTENGENAENK
jgi:hypothetical protein